MNPLRTLARPLLAAGFIWSGVQQLRDTEAAADAAAPAVNALSDRAEQVPNDPKLIVRANGGAMIAAGLMFATGKAPRVASIVLTATMAGATYTQNQFWNETDETAKATKKAMFAKDMALVGAALLATAGSNSKSKEREAIRKLALKSASLATENAKLKALHAADGAVKKLS